MSRSFKKFPCVKDRDGAGRKKAFKKMYNRRIRRNMMDCANGNAYKKLNDSWEICDWMFVPDPDDPQEINRMRRK